MPFNLSSSVPAPPTGRHDLQYQSDGVGNISVTDSDGVAEILTTKGDIAVFGTAPDRLPVGANDTFPRADSTQPLGLRYDALATGDIPALPESKITNLVSDLALKAPLASPTFTGTPAAPTPSTADNSTKLATTAYVQAQGYLTSVGSIPESSVTGLVADLALKAPLASPALTGTPTAPTASTSTNTTQIATTAYVQAQGFVTTGNGPGNGSIATKTANYTVTGTDYTLLGDATSAAFTFTLPASPTSGEIHNFKKIDSSAHDITVSGNGKNIDGGSSLTISAQYASYTVQYDGTQWFVI